MDGDGQEREAGPEEVQGARTGGDVEVVTLPWSESGEREWKDALTSGTIAVLLVLAVVGFFNAARGQSGAHLGSALFAIVLVGIAMVSWYGPFGSVGSRVSVDQSGLWIRHDGWTLWPTGTRIELLVPRHLPASQIGTVEAVSEDGRKKIWRKSMALRYEGRRLGWTRTTVNKETVDAVLIEQLDPGLKRPWWLIRCRQSDELIRALELAKTANEL